MPSNLVILVSISFTFLSLYLILEYCRTVGKPCAEADKAYLVCEDDGSMRLVVFGDSNAKRNVRNVVSVDITVK